VGFIGEQFGHEFADLDEALGIFDLVAYYDAAGNLVDLEQEVAYDFAGPALFEALASCAQADDYLTLHQVSEDWTYRILFDGQGGYRRPGG
jgi:hypothetical protein